MADDAAHLLGRRARDRDDDESDLLPTHRLPEALHATDHRHAMQRAPVFGYVIVQQRDHGHGALPVMVDLPQQSLGRFAGAHHQDSLAGAGPAHSATHATFESIPNRESLTTRKQERDQPFDDRNRSRHRAEHSEERQAADEHHRSCGHGLRLSQKVDEAEMLVESSVQAKRRERRETYRDQDA
ncbi:MAG TPA: hypothetical protein VFW04_18970 [Gemmatimonadaceae bacterium]|nr:hypothetical protein [Gemmatimonadaceae bacterium]